VTIDYTLITGLSIGAEYVEADEEAGIENSCFIIDLLILRVVIELTGSR